MSEAMKSLEVAGVVDLFSDILLTEIERLPNHFSDGPVLTSDRAVRPAARTRRPTERSRCVRKVPIRLDIDGAAILCLDAETPDSIAASRLIFQTDLHAILPLIA